MFHAFCVSISRGLPAPNTIKCIHYMSPGMRAICHFFEGSPCPELTSEPQESQTIMQPWKSTPYSPLQKQTLCHSAPTDAILVPVHRSELFWDVDHACEVLNLEQIPLLRAQRILDRQWKIMA